MTRPVQFFVTARLKMGDRLLENNWPMWLVPSVSHSGSAPIYLHASCPPELQQLFPDARPLADRPTDGVVVAARLDVPLVELMEAGGRVLLLPDGQNGSFPLSDEWFLRPLCAGPPAVVQIRAGCWWNCSISTWPGP